MSIMKSECREGHQLGWDGAVFEWKRGRLALHPIVEV